MSSALTTIGQNRINELAGLEQPLIIDRIVLALIPGLDPAAAVDRSQQMPDGGDIVHEYTIPAEYKGYVTPDQVVYSMVLGSDIGNFSFNWMGAVEAVTGTVIIITTTPESQKWKTDLPTNSTGNMITRNMMTSFQDAQALTGISISAETWQFDYQAEFNTHINNTSNPHNVTQAQIGYTAADVMEKLQSIDGPGSGLDADLLDNIESKYYQGHDQGGGMDDDPNTPLYHNFRTQHANCPNSRNLWYIRTQWHSNSGWSQIAIQYHSGISAYVRSYHTVDGMQPWTRIDNAAQDILDKIKTVDGNASGLDADLLDGKHLSTITNEYQSYIADEIADLVDTSPTTLDTLNELAAALGDDPNFSTTIINLIATKLNISAHTVHAALVVDPTTTGTDKKHVTNTQAKKWEDIANGFPNLLAQSGYQKFPGGLILQWGRPSCTSTVVFPIAFPAAALNVVTGDYMTTTMHSQGVKDLTLTGFTFVSNASPGDVAYWLALGY